MAGGVFCFQCDRLQLTGGEPLLHPALLDLPDVARASGISPQLSLTTNGLLLERQPDALFERLDRLTLSWYSSAPLPEAAVERAKARSREHGVVLTVKRIERFARMDPPSALDEEQARGVHAACWLRVRCHMVRSGRFYCCTRPPHLERSLAARGLAAQLAREDGLELQGSPAALLTRLVAYLEHLWMWTPRPYYAAHLAAGVGNIDVLEGIPAKATGIDYSAYTMKDGHLQVPRSPGFGLKLGPGERR